MHLTKIMTPRGKHRRLPITAVSPLKPGDIAVLHTTIKNSEWLQKLQKQMKVIFPENRCVIFSDGMKLEIVTPAPEPS